MSWKFLPFLETNCEDISDFSKDVWSPTCFSDNYFFICEKSAFYLIFKSHVSHTLSCLCTHCQRNQLSSEKLSWRVEDRLVPVPGAFLFEVKVTPMLHWWTFRKASSNLGAFVTLHSGWNFPAEAKDDYYPHFIVQRLNNLSLRFKVFYSIWQRWVYIFI